MATEVHDELIIKFLAAICGSGGIGVVLTAYWNRRKARHRRIEIETPLKVVADGAAATVLMNQAELARMARRLEEIEAARDRQDQRIDALEKREVQQARRIEALSRENGQLRQRVDELERENKALVAELRKREE